MTREEALEVIQGFGLSRSQAEALLVNLDPCLRFVPVIAEMSAVTRGVGGVR
jgi:hypothetical protein